MGHIERCAEWILFWGEVEMVPAIGRAENPRAVKKMLELARKMEETAPGTL
jgi:hypothetical protein